LGRLGLKVSEIGFGCGATNGLMTGGDFDLQQRAVARALAHGITYFDRCRVWPRLFRGKTSVAS